MLKKTITYMDLDGNPVTEDFYFNLSNAELAEVELTHKGGFADFIKAAIAAEDGKTIIETFKEILRLSYGKRSPDGKRFMKSEEIWLEFYETDAYSQLFMELVTDAQAASAFVNGIVPSDLSSQVAAKMATVELPQPAQPTEKQIVEMTREELLRALANTPPPERTDDAS